MMFKTMLFQLRNSVMAHNLQRIGEYTNIEKYTTYKDNMLNNFKNDIMRGGVSFSNWAKLLFQKVVPLYKVVIVGKDALEFREKFNAFILPPALFMGVTQSVNNEFLKGKFSDDIIDKKIDGKTMIYVCQNKVCQPGYHLLKMH